VHFFSLNKNGRRFNDFHLIIPPLEKKENRRFGRANAKCNQLRELKEH
jgi:hypothetical protein